MTTATAREPAHGHGSAAMHQAEAEIISCEQILDQALEDTFPASDPVSSNHCN